MIETRGWVAMAEGADAMVKSANVEVVGWQQVGGGYVSVIVRGDVASVRAATEAGAAAAAKVGDVVAINIIPRPHESLSALLPLKHLPSA